MAKGEYPVVKTTTTAVEPSEAVFDAVGFDQATEAVTQGSVNQAVAEAGGLPKLTAKKIEKQRKEDERYWNTMISRREAMNLVQGAIAEERQKYNTLLLSLGAMADVLKSKGLITEQEVTEATKNLLNKLYQGPEDATINPPGIVTEQ